MKPHIKKLGRAFALTVLLLAAGLQPAVAATKVAFAAGYSGVISPPNGPPPVDLSGTGTASWLGTSTNKGHVFVTGTASSCPTTGFAVENDETLTSSTNGDQITLTIHDESCPISPGVYHGSGTYVVTGGTGHFAGATGSGTFSGLDDFNQGTFAFSLLGTISAPTK